jgi:hypothetical protein
MLIDVINSSTTMASNVTLYTINYDFKRYYFQLNGLGFNLPSVNLSVNSLPAPLVQVVFSTVLQQYNSFVNLYGYDTNVVASVNLAVALTSDSNAILYSATQNLSTFQVLNLTNSIKIVTDFTTPTIVSGAGLNGSCTSMCYLQLNSVGP